MTAMAHAIKKEVAFLKKFRDRFPSKKNYRAALEDLLDQGLIMRASYNAVTKVSGTRAVKPLMVKSKPRKRSDERVELSGSCGATWSSHC